ncbi:MAG: alpha/beta fold hydrolase [Acidimicrobiales bacterium]
MATAPSSHAPRPISSRTLTIPAAAGGHRLAARIDRPDGAPEATAVFAHCFTCTKDLQAVRRIGTGLAGHGIAVLSFDFTGLGMSEGDFAQSTFSADVDDLVAAARFLGDEIEPPRLLVGHSLGGAAVLAAAGRLPSVTAVATIGAPADVAHVTSMFAEDLDTIRAQGRARVTIGGRPFTVGADLVRDLSDHRLTTTVAGLDVALLLLHAPRDPVVGIDNAERLFLAARHPKSFTSLDDADHLLSDPDDADYAAEVIAAWAGRYLTGDRPHPYDDATVVSVSRAGDGLSSDVFARGFDLRVDEPRAAGGTESGPTPYDYLGAALASCTSLTLRMYADRRGMALDEVSTAVSFGAVHAADCAECEHRDGRVERFHRVITVTGDLSDDERQRLTAIADRCPVHRTLTGQIEIHTDLAPAPP